MNGQRKNFVAKIFNSPIPAHVVPFAAWLAIMFIGDYFFDSTPWRYTVQTFSGLVLFLLFRPWRWYKAPRLRNLPLALGVGILVFLVWIVPEIRIAGTLPGIQDIYLRFGILPLGKLVEVTTASIYAPETSGWMFTIIRLSGSAFIIAVIEEFFWRGFLYRWLIDRDFTKVKLSLFEWEAFIIACVLFGLEHNRWLVGIIAGVAYLLLMIKTRDITAVCCAHVVTNLLLGLYVIATQSYHFW